MSENAQGDPDVGRLRNVCEVMTLPGEEQETARRRGRPTHQVSDS